MVEATQHDASGGALAFITRRPIAITMFVVATAVFGLVSFSKLSVDLLPEISYPTLTVRTTWPGAAPEDVEERVSERLQEALSTLPSLVRTSSISRAGTSDVLLDFDWGTTMAFAVQDVREKLDSVLLPRGAERPLILRYDPNLDPILRIGITSARGQGGESELVHVRWLAENRVKRELEAIAGVAAVQIRGGMEEEIHVKVDPFKLAARQIDPSMLANRLAQENINASGGSLLEGSTEYLVRTLNEFRTVGEIEDLAVVQRGDALIRVRDLAEVQRTHRKREVVSRLGGGEMVELAVYREAGANIVKLAQEVKALVLGSAEMQATAAEVGDREDSGGGSTRFDEQKQTDYLAFRMRKDLDFELLSDQSTFIEDAIADVKSSAVVGAILAVIVIWLFLRRLAPTLIIGAVIPISVVITFAPMFAFGVNLNIMSLGGLALGIGNLVDNAIVLLESITRCRDEGDSIQRAAVRGTREVIGAVTSSTLTTVVAFAPIAFVSGIAGQIFGDQAVTVVTSQIVSLIVAILLIPMLVSRRWLGGVARTDLPPRPERVLSEVRWTWPRGIPNVLLVAGRSVLSVLGVVVRVGALALGVVVRGAAILLKPVSRGFDAVWDASERAYLKVLSGSLRHPFLVLGASLLLFVLAALRVPALGVELLPEMHQGEFTAHVGLPIGTPLAFTDRVMHEIDRDVRALEGVHTTALTVGIEPDALSRDVEGPHTARLLVRLEPHVSGPGKEDILVARVRDLVATHPAVQSVEIRRPTPFAIDAPIAVEVKGYDLAVIEGLAHEVHARLARLDGLEDLRTSARPGHPEALIRFDRDKTLEYGLDLAAVSNLVRDQVLGNVSTRFNEGEERIDVRVIGDDVVLSTLQSVLDLVVNPDSPTPVPLRAVAEVFTVQGPAEIRRIGNTRGVVVTAEGTGLDLGGLQRRIEGSLASLETPADVVVELGGQKREMEEAQASMRFALALAVFLVYVVMASQFESLLQPFVILLTVPLAGVGVVFTLDLLDVPVSVVVFLGLIILAGIVVNNAIVLVDRINQKRAEGSSVRDAVLDAGHTRLRPILMTTATTVFGLLPMTGWLAALPVVGALGSGQGAELRAPMAITVVAGLTFATLLTLLVIPTIYALVARGNRGTAPAA